MTTKNSGNSPSYRRKLDNIIFDELELTKDERKEVYYTTAKLVQKRLQKARSAWGMRKTIGNFILFT